MRRDRYLQDVAADERRRVAVLAVGPALHRTTIHDKRLRHRGRGVYRETRETGAVTQGSLQERRGLSAQMCQRYTVFF